MNWHRRIGQLAIVGFEGTAVSAELRSLAREFDLGGVILFERNITSPDQVAELAYEVQQLGRSLPLWVSVDQEGGRVARLRAPFTAWPPMATLGRSGDERLAERFAKALATELTAVGISLDYAPVLDVHTNPANPVIGDRALAEKAEDVARLGAAIVRTLQANGVAACGKHFPGHGDTSADSHLELPVVEHPPDRLRAVEFVPFRAAIEAEVASIMTAHVLVPAFDDEQPATLSRVIVHGLLREELGYVGLILADGLEMSAVADRYPIGDAAVRAVAAGCDGLLLCASDHGEQLRALEALIHAVEAEALPLSRIEDAQARQRRAKERFLMVGSPGASPRARRPQTARALRALIGCDEHREIAEEMARYL